MAQAHAFISYVRENSAVVDRLAGDLRAHGVKVWLDRDDIAPGQYWRDAIDDAIQNGAYFIACFSHELNEREETHMHVEIRLAIEKLMKMPRQRVWFIPVIINDSVIPAHRISGHETLRDINAVSLFDDWNEGIRKILRSMKLEDDSYRRVHHPIELIRYHPGDRIYAIDALSQIGSTASAAIPSLTKIVQNADPRICELAFNAIKAIDPSTIDTLPPLVANFWKLYIRHNDRTSIVRLISTYSPKFALTQLGPIMLTVLAQDICDPSETQALSAKVLKELGADGVPSLIAALAKSRPVQSYRTGRDPRWDLAFASHPFELATHALREIGEDAVPFLVEALKNYNQDIGNRARDILKQMDRLPKGQK